MMKRERQIRPRGNRDVQEPVKALLDVLSLPGGPQSYGSVE
jgi:hypothetical protein